jgi:hypothetical protein
MKKPGKHEHIKAESYEMTQARAELAWFLKDQLRDDNSGSPINLSTPQIAKLMKTSTYKVQKYLRLISSAQGRQLSDKRRS